MPRRKSDAAEGDAQKAAPDATAEDAAPEAPEASPLLSTPDEAAEPGAPAPAGPPPEAADPSEAIEPYREPAIGTPEVADPAEPYGEPATETPEIETPEVETPEVETPEAAAAVELAAADEPAFGSPPESVPESVEEAHEPEEEAGGSLASRVLLALVLLIAGAALALWGAPRLAPHLPSGMSGVANWLTPGARDAEARIAALEARLDERVGGVESRLTGFASPDDIDARVGTAATRLDGEIAAVRESVAQLGSSELPQQVARLQSAVEGQTAELATLKEQLSGTEAASGQLTQEAVERIDVYRAELDGLRAEVGTLQDHVAGLATQVDQAVQNAEREIESARTRVETVQSEADTRLSAAEVDTNLALIRAAIESGAPFQAPLEALQGHAGVTVPAGLVAAAPTGVATMARLRDDFSDSAHAAIRASIMAGAGEGVLARTRAFFGAQMASRSLTPQDGVSPDAVLSRVEDRLRQDDLDGALAEAAELPSEAQAAMASWISAARLRAGATDGLGEIEAALPATN